MPYEIAAIYRKIGRLFLKIFYRRLVFLKKPLLNNYIRVEMLLVRTGSGDLVAIVVGGSEKR